jgi:hypothetical protein
MPHCGDAHPQVKLVERYFGKQLCFAFRHFPLTQVHLYAEQAAESAEVAAAHDRFWEMHDGLFENQELLGPPLFFELARKQHFTTRTEPGAYGRHVRAKGARGFSNWGAKWRQRHTHIFINGRRHDGAYLFQDLAAVINGISLPKFSFGPNRDSDCNGNTRLMIAG